MDKSSRIKSRKINSYKRKIDTRDPRTSEYYSSKILISFKDFIPNILSHNKQSFESWEKENLLSQLNEKLKYLCKLTMSEAKTQSFIKEYGKFPNKTEFECPIQLKNITRWAILNRISGQKCRVVGYIDENIFNIVFLDKDHEFWKTEKKNT